MAQVIVKLDGAGLTALRRDPGIVGEVDKAAARVCSAANRLAAGHSLSGYARTRPKSPYYRQSAAATFAVAKARDSRVGTIALVRAATIPAAIAARKDNLLRKAVGQCQTGGSE
ncbi:hypothetical protein PSRA_0805 [Pseudoscardovia radai]|uniref:Phage protein n=1 Tax=Pseudoscardovia radai TaxID=987066 RepID=A0A261EY00_9BIFI|nr:hypothetical protein [Pseudoscardovia radai]OZG51725.1 hypothetical protein PSRA_0805 [Pseudoscardovia radai]